MANFDTKKKTVFVAAEKRPGERQRVERETKKMTMTNKENDAESIKFGSQEGSVASGLLLGGELAR